MSYKTCPTICEDKATSYFVVIKFLLIFKVERKDCSINRNQKLYGLKLSLFKLRLIQEPQTGLICYNVLHILLESVCPQPLLLTGHHGEISAMTFGKGSRPILLCSASADYIIVWDIELCQRRTQEGKKTVQYVLKCELCTKVKICPPGQGLTLFSLTLVYFIHIKL